MRLFVALIVAFFIGSELADPGAVARRTVIGVVTDFEPGRSISIANEQMSRTIFPMALNERVKYQGAIAAGALVALRYRRALGDPTPVIEEVRVINGPRR